MKVVGKTDIGRIKKLNQDSIFYSVDAVGELPNLFIIADGMGGYKAGEFASQFIIDRIIEEISKPFNTYKCVEELLNSIIIQTDNELMAKAGSDDKYQGMGSTLLLATIINDDLLVANVGDSRLYLLMDKLRQITEDHTIVMDLVKRSFITKKEASSHPDKHKITRAMGYGAYPDFYHIKLKPKDKILMCTDGLTNMLTDVEIEKILNNNIEASVENLIESANNNGGEDNISAIIIEID